MGRFALLVVFTLFILLSYFVITTNRSNTMAVERNVKTFNVNQSHNIAHSVAQIAVKNFESGDWKITDDNKLQYYPADNDNFNYWNEFQGYYRISAIKNNDIITITSVAKTANSPQEVDVKVTLKVGGSMPEFDKALHSHSSISLEGSAKIYGNAATTTLVANSVYFGWSTDIYGDFYLQENYVNNPHELITLANRNGFWYDIISGDLLPLPDALPVYTLPPYPTFPEGLESKGTFETPWVAGEYYLINDDGYYDTIKATASRTITIDVGSGNRVIRVKDFDVSQGHIELIGSGSLTLYVENDFTLGGSSTINYESGAGDPSNIHMYYSGENPPNIGGNTRYNGSMYIQKADLFIAGSNGILGDIISGGDTITITGNAEAIVRVLYAPNTNVFMSGSGRLRGALVAGSFSGSGNSRLFFEAVDSHIPDFIGEGGDGLEIISWF